MTEHQHLTTRRGFIAAMGFGGVSLYGLWAAYGVAPGPLSLFGGHDAHAPADDLGAGHAGHGAAPAGAAADEFRRLVAAFVDRYRLPDGSVHPRHPSATAASTTPPGAHEAHAQHATPTAPTTDLAPGSAPIEVFLLAQKWFYQPGHLRLDAGATYRLRMMAVDVSHGASIQLGRGGRMVRLRPNREATLEVRFERPGNYLVYCTVYCGQAHDFMQSRIDVV